MGSVCGDVGYSNMCKFEEKCPRNGYLLNQGLRRRMKLTCVRDAPDALDYQSGLYELETQEHSLAQQ